MQNKKDEEYYIPVMDCGFCKKKDVPISSSTWRNEFDTNIEVNLYYCPFCDYLLENNKIKGYINEKELSEKGWDMKTGDLFKKVNLC